MGRLFLVEYDQTPDERIFLCPTCHTHIARGRDLLHTIQDGMLFKKVVNVMTDGPTHYLRLDNFTFAFVYCVKCNKKLGANVEIGDHVLEGRYTYVSNTSEMQGGLLYWDGQELRQIQYGETNMPMDVGTTC